MYITNMYLDAFQLPHTAQAPTAGPCDASP